MKYVLGIDVGKAGGWAVANRDHRISDYGMMPLAGGEVHVKLLGDLVRALGTEDTLVVIEKVHSMPLQSSKSTFSFGVSFGKIIGMCQTHGVPYELVLPTTWKKSVLFDTDRDKQAAMNFVCRRFPYVNLIPAGKKSQQDGIADAVCIATWGMNKWLTQKK